MFITNKDMEVFENLVRTIRQSFEELLVVDEYRDALYAVRDAESTIQALHQKKDKENVRKTKYMADKRSLNPTYGGADWYQKKKGDK